MSTVPKRMFTAEYHTDAVKSVAQPDFEPTHGVRFSERCPAAGVRFQRRDLRTTNTTDTDDLATAQMRLPHTSRTTVER